MGRPDLDREVVKLKVIYGKTKIGRSQQLKCFDFSKDSLKFSGNFSFDTVEKPQNLTICLTAYNYGYFKYVWQI